MPYAPSSRHARNRRRRLLAVPLSLMLLLSAVGLVGLLGSSSSSATPATMFSQVNEVRAKNGRGPLKWNKHLAAVAAQHARKMSRQSRLHHNPKLTKDVGSFRRVGENVGYGPRSWSVEKAFVNSRPHRANILGRYKQIGIGQTRDAKGRLWVVQVFRS